MQDSFDQKKSSILSDISSTDRSTPDASPKGTIDELCIPIINLINSSKDMVTTSSCSGRVSVFVEGIKETNEHESKIGAKGNEGYWLFVTHDVDSLENWYASIEFQYDTNKQFSDELKISTRYILFKFEPLILHVKCRDQTTANFLYTTAMNCGFRESGIGSKNIVAIRISIKLDVPIGFQDSHGGLISFVSKEYIKIITKLSVDRFRENSKKLNQLYKSIENSKPPATSAEKSESKEERRERKKREGLARRAMVQSKKGDSKENEASAETPDTTQHTVKPQ